MRFRNKRVQCCQNKKMDETTKGLLTKEINDVKLFE